jgi:hypothetical protein
MIVQKMTLYRVTTHATPDRTQSRYLRMLDTVSQG